MTLWNKNAFAYDIRYMEEDEQGRNIMNFVSIVGFTVAVVRLLAQTKVFCKRWCCQALSLSSHINQAR